MSYLFTLGMLQERLPIKIVYYYTKNDHIEFEKPSSIRHLHESK